MDVLKRQYFRQYFVSFLNVFFSGSFHQFFTKLHKRKLNKGFLHSSTMFCCCSEDSASVQHVEKICSCVFETQQPDFLHFMQPAVRLPSIPMIPCCHCCCCQRISVCVCHQKVTCLIPEPVGFPVPVPLSNSSS